MALPEHPILLNKYHIYLSQRIVIRPEQAIQEIIQYEPIFTHIVKYLQRFGVMIPPELKKRNLHYYDLAPLQGL